MDVASPVFCIWVLYAISTRIDGRRCKSVGAGDGGVQYAAICTWSGQDLALNNQLVNRGVSYLGSPSPLHTNTIHS